MYCNLNTPPPMRAQESTNIAPIEHRDITMIAQGSPWEPMRALVLSYYVHYAELLNLPIAGSQWPMAMH